MSDYAHLERWLAAAVETEGLEFKAARNTFNKAEVARYTAAIGNEGGGWLVLGVSNEVPRKVVGTQAFCDDSSQNQLKQHIYDKLKVAVDVHVINHSEGKVVAIRIPSRPAGDAIDYEGKYLMRIGESVQAMPPDRLRQIFNENKPDWIEQPAREGCSSADVVNLLDTAAYFDLRGEPYPTSRDAVLERFCSDGLIRQNSGEWVITNLAAITLAKRLAAFSEDLAARAPRFIHYDGVGKTRTKNEIDGVKGYAVGFEGLVKAVYDAAPGNSFDESLIREERKMFPLQSLRELVANALVHQDFAVTGLSVRVELYDDRVAVTSPGEPILDRLRLINEDRARNEKLAELFRRLGLAERKGSGLDKVIDLVERHQLPGPAFEATPTRFVVTLFARRGFAEMERNERVWACFQHACLLWTHGRTMTNRSLRNRFGLEETGASSTAMSKVLRDTATEGLIVRDDDSSAASSKANYRPFWA